MTGSTISEIHRRGSYHDALTRLRGAQKPGAGVPAYTRWVNRRAARFAAAAAHRIGLSANGVTAISGIVSFAGMVVLVTAPISWWSGALAAVLLALGYVLDSADGQVARLSGTGGPAGEWLDHVVDAVRSPLIHVAVLVALFRDGHAGLSLVQVVALGFVVLTSGQFMSQILAEQLGRSAGSPDATPAVTGGVRQSVFLLPTDSGVICWMFVVWGSPAGFAAVYTAMFLINLIHSAASMVRKYRKLSALARS